uniref:Ribosome production factor 2 homolog n=1 Tax=Caligus rogercresseyi TaxID=217165 RepID=C1BR74_CALRO|nr:Brix domain-containing protein 1 [Caligus rogercresseyi]|eukprot:TRINITY_DN8936_c0_g1_i1.p1 TRINITY_DN8936_c0_g1~~TRINITY_DN8936_c0_g1_i1.p1  ORF type:complete len:322 (-),score=94.63 TRINITY_DN8936_c0_g1_i1:9-974(-)
MGVIQRVVKPKNKKSRRALEAREPKAIETLKQAIIIKGNNTSDAVREALRDLSALKKPHVINFSKKNDYRPFEDPVPIETISQRSDASLFVLGNKTKKRPNNLTFGRLYDGKILDMIELGMDSYKSLSSFDSRSKIDLGSKPCLIFNGPLFETNSELGRLKSLFIDFFRGPVVNKIRLAGIEHCISFTALSETKVVLRSYKIALKKSGTRFPRIELSDMGPHMDFSLRRTHLASEDLMKTALKRVKNIDKTKIVKNISKDDLDNTYGRVHIKAQRVGEIQTRKMKALKPSAEEKKEAAAKKVEEADKTHRKNVEAVFMETD